MARLGERQQVFALRQVGLRHGLQRVQPLHCHIAPRYLGGKQQRGLLCIGLGSARLAECGVQCCTVFAEQIQLIAGGDLGVGSLKDIASQRRRVDAVGAKALAGRVQCAVNGGQLGAAAQVGERQGAVHAGLGQFQRGAVLQRLRHQGVELRITKAGPPLGLGGGVAGGAGSGGTGAQDQGLWLGQARLRRDA